MAGRSAIFWFGILPPTALTDEGLLWGIALVAGAVFFLHRHLHEGRLLYGLDTLGLALFAALGAGVVVTLLLRVGSRYLGLELPVPHNPS